MTDPKLREGWESRHDGESGEWEPIRGEHWDCLDAGETWAEEAWKNWMWEYSRVPHDVEVRSPEGEVFSLQVEVEFEPSFLVRRKKAPK